MFRNNLLKYVLFSIVAAIVLCAVGLFIFLPKEEGLTLTCKDVSVNVGDSVTLDYEVSIEYAVVYADSLDENVAVVEGNKVLGVAKGETEIVLKAEYNKKIAECKISVVVLQEDDGSNEPNGPVQEPPQDPEHDPVEDPENPSEDPKDSEVILNLRAEIFCTVENNILYLQKSTAYFNLDLSTDEGSDYFYDLKNGNYTMTSENATILKEASLGWKIVASQSGIVEIKIGNVVVISFEFVVV